MFYKLLAANLGKIQKPGTSGSIIFGKNGFLELSQRHFWKKIEIKQVIWIFSPEMTLPEYSRTVTDGPSEMGLNCSGDKVSSATV